MDNRYTPSEMATLLDSRLGRLDEQLDERPGEAESGIALKRLLSNSAKAGRVPVAVFQSSI